MWELDHKQSWAPKNLGFWTVVLEKTLDSLLDCKEIQPVHPKVNQSWIFIGKTETPILWPPDAKNWAIGKGPDVGKDWRQEEKGTTEDEMVAWHHWIDGHEFEQAPGVGDGQGSLACCSPWCHKESDKTEWLNWEEKVCRKSSYNRFCYKAMCFERPGQLTRRSYNISVFFPHKRKLEKFKITDVKCSKPDFAHYTNPSILSVYAKDDLHLKNPRRKRILTKHWEVPSFALLEEWTSSGSVLKFTLLWGLQREHKYGDCGSVRHKGMVGPGIIWTSNSTPRWANKAPVCFCSFTICPLPPSLHSGARISNPDILTFLRKPKQIFS